MAYAFLITYQVYFLLQQLHRSEAEIPNLVFLGTLAQSGAVIVASLVGGRLSDRAGRRKMFVLAAALVYASAMVLLSVASSFAVFLVAMGLSGLGFGLYFAVDLALVDDVLPDPDNAAKDLRLQLRRRPPVRTGTDGRTRHPRRRGRQLRFLYGVAALCAGAGAFAVLPIRAVR